MNRLSRKARMLGAVAVLAGMGSPLLAQNPSAGGVVLKQGWLYAIGFPDTVTVGSGIAKGVATYRVLGSAGDQQWYRLRMTVRNPNGGWMTPPGTPEVWVNLNYAMWVQEVLR